MAKYNFKYWFEWGCSEDHCPCLWSKDTITKERFGYAVDLFGLPISKDLRSFLIQLGIKHDEALDWEHPPNPLTWSKEEEADFYKKAYEGYERIKEELGEDYSIEYCESR